MTALPSQAIGINGTGGTSPLGAGASTTYSFTFDRSDFSSAVDLFVTEVSLDIASVDASALGLQLGSLEFYLESPGAAQTLTLKGQGGNTGSNQYSAVTLTDTGVSSIDTAGGSPITGSFRPQGSGDNSLTSDITNFAGFDGLTVSSTPQTWNLQVFNNDFGVGSATLGTFTLNVDAAVPFEMETTLGLLVLGGLAGGRYWFKKQRSKLATSGMDEPSQV
jgi:hypothetical protein